MECVCHMLKKEVLEKLVKRNKKVFTQIYISNEYLSMRM